MFLAVNLQDHRALLGAHVSRPWNDRDLLLSFIEAIHPLVPRMLSNDKDSTRLCKTLIWGLKAPADGKDVEIFPSDSPDTLLNRTEREPCSLTREPEDQRRLHIFVTPVLSAFICKDSCVKSSFQSVSIQTRYSSERAECTGTSI